MAVKQSQYWSNGKRRAVWIPGTLVYLLVILWAISYAVDHGFTLTGFPSESRKYVVIGGIGLALVPTLYWWWESWTFESWLYSKTSLSDKDREFEKERFETNRELARAVWGVVLAVFTAFLINAG
jgi:hypothetical protein